MISKTTLSEIWWPLMGKEFPRLDPCAICGRTSPLNEHHIVKRSAGKLFDEQGREVAKPTITLCGIGNHGGDGSGRLYCHGKAHAGLLHFRWVGDDETGHLEHLLLTEPTDYLTALGMQGWVRTF